MQGKELDQKTPDPERIKIRFVIYFRSEQKLKIIMENNNYCYSK